MKQEANFPLLGLQVLYVLFFARHGTLEPRRTGVAPAGPLRPFWSWTLLVVINLFALAHMRDNIQWSWIRTGSLSDYKLTSPGFEGWRCAASMGEPIDAAVRFIRERTRPDESLFVFPDATLIYGLAGRESYRSAPFIFDLRNAPPEGPVKERFIATFEASPPDWIVLHWHTEAFFSDTRTLLDHLRLRNILKSRFRTVWWRGEFQIMQRIR